MATPVLDQVSGRLYALSTSGASGVPNYWAGYLCSTSASFGTQASLQQAWADAGGVFLFLNAAPAAAAFAAALIGLLPQLSPRGWVRWLWIANPNDPAAYWQAQLLDALPANAPGGAWKVVRDAYFNVGSYAVSISGGTALELSAASGQEGVQIAAPGLRFVAPDGLYAAQGQRGALAFNGIGIGGFIFDISLVNGTQAIDDMQRLGVMLRYGQEDPASLAGSIAFIDMPLLKQLSATAIPMRLSYDPLNPLIGDRSGASFFPTSGTVPPALSCALLTNRGRGTLLTPLNATAPLSPARLVFGRTPLYAADEETGAVFDYHLAPDGAFALALDVSDTAHPPVLPANAGRVMLGASGAEYAVLPPNNACQIYFQGGGAAYVPAADPAPAGSRPDRAPLSGLGTTAYASVIPGSPGATGLAYYAQPLQAPLFDVEGVVGAGFLDFHEMQAATLPAYQAGDRSPPKVMPIGVYSRVSSTVIAQARLIEEAALAPARRAAVGLPVTGPQQLTSMTPLDDAPVAVTPQGLVAVLSANRQSWAGVLLANMPASVHTQLTLTKVGPHPQAALQSNQLFFVVSNVTTFMDQSSVAYQLTAANAVRLMQSTGVPLEVANNVKQVLAAQQPPYPLFVNETAFNQVTAGAAGTWLPQVQNAAGLLRADIEGWNFQLSPRSWRGKGDAPTLMLFKFCNRALTELAADPAAWGWKEAAMDEHDSLDPTRKELARILAAARARAEMPDVPESDPYLRFYVDVATNPLWNGVLFLNAPVDFTQMPAALQFLAAGIDTGKFYAHHIGFSVTPYQAAVDSVSLGQTAAFGLIDYSDPQDLVASVPPQPFGFKTLQLRVVFANAAVADFSAQVELMVNRLLGSSVQKQDPSRGNNLVLDGSYQRVGGAPSYSFVLRGENLYATQNTALLSVEVRGARLETSTATAADSSLASRFILSGKLRFAQIDGFDLFSYGPDPATGADGFISFNGLAIGMSFPLATPAQQTFTIAEAALSFDTSSAATVARTRSLANNFPLQLLQLAGSPNLAGSGEPPRGQSPADMGFTSIGAPFEQTPLESPWYGLIFNLDFGTLGALTGAIGLKVTLLAAWMQGPPQGEAPPAFIGLKLADTKAVGGSLPLQGVLKLGFRSFQFETYTNDQNELAYLLRMHRLALSVLAWSFPPGNTDLMLYGAPGSPKNSLGWYAAYAKDPKEKDSAAALAGPAAGPLRALPAPTERQLRSGRRKPPVGTP